MQEEISLLLQRDHFNLAVLAKSQAALIFTSANSFGESACIAVQQLRAVSTSTSAVSKISVHRCTFITSLHTFHRSEMKNYSCLVQTILHTFGVRLGRLLHFFFFVPLKVHFFVACSPLPVHSPFTQSSISSLASRST